MLHVLYVLHTVMCMYICNNTCTCTCTCVQVRPAQLSCLGGSAGRVSARYAVCHGFLCAMPSGCLWAMNWWLYNREAAV